MMLNDRQYHEYQELNDLHHPKEKIKNSKSFIFQIRNNFIDN
jgi:hypothetical protein